MRIIIIGPPGSGKGTLCEQLKADGFYHMVASDLIRELAYDPNTPEHLQAEGQRAIEEGVLVSDQYIGQLVGLKLHTLPHNQLIMFDGYPRTVGQADDLLALTPIDHVIVLNAPEDLLMARMSGRRLCQDCGKIYHLTNRPPLLAGTCDCCGGGLMQRKDDVPKTIRYRLEVFHNTTAPVIDHLINTGVRVTLLDQTHAENTDADTVFQAVSSILGLQIKEAV